MSNFKIIFICNRLGQHRRRFLVLVTEERIRNEMNKIFILTYLGMTANFKHLNIPEKNFFYYKIIIRMYFV